MSARSNPTVAANSLDVDDISTAEVISLRSETDRESATPARIYSAAIRSRVAAQFGISVSRGPNGEPSDAEVLLTGTDAATITAQAKRLAEIDANASATLTEH